MVAIRRLLVGFSLFLISISVHAALIASVSNQSLIEGDTFKLTVSTTDGRSSQAPDFTPLEKDFTILNTSQSHALSITNGNRSGKTDWVLSLMPKRMGSLTVPSLSLNGQRSRPIAIEVKPAPKNQTVPTADTVIIESSLDRDSVFLGGQTLLTVRILHRGNLVNATLSEPEAQNSLIQQVHETSYQRAINGTAVVIIERVYAVFAENPGTLEVSGQLLQAELALGNQRGIFGYSNTKTVVRKSAPQQINVLPLPEFAKNKDAITANSLKLEQQWNTSLNNLKVGDSITRTLLSTATGATSGQIPPIFIEDIAGIKQYSDQPALNDAKSQQGIIGTRKESIAYVLTKTGTFEVPAIILHWVNSKTGKVQSVSVPSTTLSVAPAAPDNTATLNTAAPDQNIAATPVTAADTSTAKNTDNIWRWTTFGFAFLWLVTLLLYLSKSKKVDYSPSIAETTPASHFKPILSACRTNNAAETLRLFNLWGCTLANNLKTNHDICAYIGVKEITDAIMLAEQSAYNSAADSRWSGTQLAKQLEQWHRNRNLKSANDVLPPLYKT